LVDNSANGLTSDEMADQSLDELIDAVMRCLACISNQHTGKPDIEKNNLDFWLDLDSVVFMTSPGMDDIHCAQLDDLTTHSELFEIILDQSIISTFLTTEDLILMLSVMHSQSLYDLRMAAIDRSTGCALVRTQNLFDKSILEKSINKTNQALSDSADQPWLERYSDNKAWEFGVAPYRRISYPGNIINKRLIDNSYRRLRSFLLAIEMHTLAKFNGLKAEENDEYPT